MGEAALSIATKLVNAIQSGRREASYKQCFALALTMECSAEPSRKSVNLFALADRFIDLYWSPLEPFDGSDLRQVKRGDSALLQPIRILKSESTRPAAWKPGRRRGGRVYERAQRSLAQRIAQYPATHLQPKTAGSSRATADFLYHSKWLHKKLSQSELELHEWQLELLPGVAEALAASSALLTPVLQALWQEEVVAMNQSLSESRRLTQHLFSSDRKVLQAVRKPLRDIQADRCFYCEAPLDRVAHIDHVIPWSRCGLDDLANLVAVDPRCNQRKADHLPAETVVRAATGRKELNAIADQLEWEMSPMRVRSTGLALIDAAADGTPLWTLPGELVTKTSRPKSE